ncbi:MAG: hypothetical protein AAFR04_01655 [Pseudomonadota bacterium]
MTAAQNYVKGTIWSILDVRSTPSLAFGDRAIALSRMRGYALEESRDRDNEALLLNFVLFAMVAAGVTVAIIEQAIDPKFYIIVAILGGIGLMSLGEVLSARSVRIYTLRIDVEDEKPLTLMTADRADVLKLAHVLEHCGIRRA